MTVLADIRATEELAAGDACEFRFPARRSWRQGVVVLAGGSGFWHVRDVETGKTHRSLYMEHVRAPGTDPWERWA